MFRGSRDPVRREHRSRGQACRCVGSKLGQFRAGTGVEGTSSLLSRHTYPRAWGRAEHVNMACGAHWGMNGGEVQQKAGESDGGKEKTLKHAR